MQYVGVPETIEARNQHRAQKNNLTGRIWPPGREFDMFDVDHFMYLHQMSAES